MSGASGKVSGQGAGDRIREPVGIEYLAQWAYGEQMVQNAKREQIVTKAKGPLAAYSALWSNGETPIDSSADTNFQRASDDAWAVDDLVKEIRPIKVDLGKDLRATRYHALQRGSYSIDPPTDRPATMDDAGNRWPTDGILRIDPRALVMVHASRATRPELLGKPKWRIKPVHKGMVRHPRSKGGAYRFGWYHHVEIDGISPGEVAEAAAIYRAWWEALDRLRQQLRGVRLGMFMLTDAMPPKPQAGA